MTPEERKKLDHFLKKSDQEKERWSKNASEQERADMDRLISMNKYETRQLTRNQLDRIQQTSSHGADELDRIMKLAGLQSNLNIPSDVEISGHEESPKVDIYQNYPAFKALFLKDLHNTLANLVMDHDNVYSKGSSFYKGLSKNQSWKELDKTIKAVERLIELYGGKVKSPWLVGQSFIDDSQKDDAERAKEAAEREKEAAEMEKERIRRQTYAQAYEKNRERRERIRAKYGAKKNQK